MDEARRAAPKDRQRLVLEVVEPGRARAFVVPCQPDGSVAYRGLDLFDYTCGSCGRAVAIGVRPGMFQGIAFACACGALNHVR